jgi:nitrogen regulatory protein PII
MVMKKAKAIIELLKLDEMKDALSTLYKLKEIWENVI